MHPTAHKSLFRTLTTTRTTTRTVSCASPACIIMPRSRSPRDRRCTCTRAYRAACASGVRMACTWDGTRVRS
eukprot:4803350-Prymnesium_polylepis.1